MRRFLAPLAVTLFALFAAQPLFVRQLTCSDDSAFHIGRAVVLEKLIEAGHFFPRWSPHMAHGYGYPFFNYYAPLSSYFFVLVHKLGFIYPLAFHICLGLSIWLAGTGAYAFVREWWGDAAGVAAAVVYLTAPYLAYDVLFRGNLAEIFALTWPPVILFILHRALLATGRQQLAAGSWNVRIGIWDLLASLSFAALIYTHNATSLAAAPLFAGYIALIAYSHRDWRKLIHGGLVLLLGLALSAHFWLPALAESNLVQTDRLLVPPIFTYYTNYLSLGELLAPPVIIDPLLINPSPAKALGLAAAMLAVVGIAALAYRLWLVAYDRQHAQYAANNTHLGFWNFELGIFFLIALLAYAVLTLPISRFVWDNVPLVKFIQFPWRALGPAALCAAILAGAGVHWLPKRPWLAASAIVLIASIGHLSWWYPRYCGQFKEIDLAQIIQYEYDTFTLGTTAKGEFLPRTVRIVPGDNSIAQALIRGEQPQYLSGLPADSTITVTNADTLNYWAAVLLPSPTRVTFNQFYFPGWTAIIDDQRADIEPGSGTGLITIIVPAGTHDLRFYFGSTPIRRAASAISIIALLITAYCVLRIAQNRNGTRNSQLARDLSYAPSAFLLLPIALLFLRLLVIDRTANPLRRSAFDGQTINVGQPINVNLSGGLTVLSTDFPPAVASGSEFDVILYLTPRERGEREYRPRFDVVSADSAVWNNGNDALPPRWHKEPPGTQYWPVGQYAQWARHETTLPGTPPGDYLIAAAIFDLATLAPDSVIDENGSPASPVTALGTIRVTRPASPPDVADLNIEHRADFDFGPTTLLGYNLDRAEARPGDTVLITLFLRADEKMPSDLSFNVFEPAYPTSAWLPGDIWRFQIFKRIPAEAEPGPFRFNLSLADIPTRSFDLAPIQLTALERVFTPPSITTTTAIRFGDSIELAGYDITTTADAINVTLLWHALTTPNVDLIAFAHVEDTNGRIVAQSDAVPVNWSRPTTGWLAGEYILDVRTLPKLPTGEYTVLVGLADRLTGARLLTVNGDRAAIGVYKAP